MLILGHTGITLGIFWFFEEKTGLKFDYRIVVMASLFPDIIDKPLGMVVLPLNNGRIIGHTLLFALILLFLGTLQKTSTTLSVGSLFHMVEDEMWADPVTLFWPFLGNFPEEEYESLYEYARTIATEYIPSPSRTFIFEVVGAIILVLFLVKRKKVSLSQHT